MPTLLVVPFAVLSVLLVLFTFPVSVPLIALLCALDRRRLGAAAAEARCVRCGHRLGPEALARADETWAAEMAELHRRFPDGIVDAVRHCWAVCTACGAGYDWDKRDRALELLPGTDPPSVPGQSGLPAR